MRKNGENTYSSRRVFIGRNKVLKMYEKITVYVFCLVLVLSGIMAVGNMDEYTRVDIFEDEDITVEVDNRVVPRDASIWERRVNNFLLNRHYFASERVSPLQHVSRDPIYIEGNDDFAALVASEGWSGDGTEFDPWIIEGYEINATDHENAIYIGNVDAHFIIRDCVLYEALIFDAFNPPHQWPSGIQLNNTENGFIEENEIFASGAGIFVKGAGDNTIFNNTVFGNGAGVMLFQTENNDIMGNTYWGNYYGAIGLWDCIYSYVSDNNMNDNGILIFGGYLEHWDSHTVDTTNTVDGNPVFYLKNQEGGTVPSNAGQVILANCTDITVEGQEDAWAIQLGFSDRCIVENNQLSPAFIDLQSSSDNTIRGNQISHHIWDALVIAFGSNDNTVVNNTFFESEIGIYILFSSNGNVIAYNNISGNLDEGLMVQESMHNQIYENEVYGNNWGIALGRNSLYNRVENNTVYDNHENGIEMFRGANENIIRNNEISRGEIGIFSWQADGNLADHNIISNASRYGINLGEANYNTYQYNNVSGCDESGIHLWDSHGNQLVGNFINDNSRTGIGIFNSSENVVHSNVIHNNSDGVGLGNSYLNSVLYNSISHSYYGMNFFLSNHNNVINNTISHNEYGINLHESHHNRMVGNDVMENDIGVHLSYSHENGIYGNILSHNFERGVNLHESSMNTVTNNTIHNNTDGGLNLYLSDRNHMEGNFISNSNYGILIGESMYNVIYDNWIYNSVWHGIRMWHSRNNAIYQNNISDNFSGIEIQEAEDNMIVYNHISDHPQNGIQIFGSNGNEIYHNSFVNNNNHAWDEGNNIWDNGHPSGGNYWDTHTYPDEYGGEEQNRPGPDGIVDDPYLIPGGDDRDRYPLTAVPTRVESILELDAPSESNGWQFVSLPVIPDDTHLSEALESILGSYDRLMYYDASAGEWLTYVPGRVEHFNVLHEWDHTMGIWIRMTEYAELSLFGRLPTVTSHELVPGWNMVGMPVGSSGNHGLPEEVSRIGHFDVSEEYNLAYTDDVHDFTFEPCQGYWIFNNGDESVIWTLEY